MTKDPVVLGRKEITNKYRKRFNQALSISPSCCIFDVFGVGDGNKLVSLVLSLFLSSRYLYLCLNLSLSQSVFLAAYLSFYFSHTHTTSYFCHIRLFRSGEKRVCMTERLQGSFSRLYLSITHSLSLSFLYFAFSFALPFFLSLLNLSLSLFFCRLIYI